MSEKLSFVPPLAVSGKENANQVSPFPETELKGKAFKPLKRKLGVTKMGHLVSGGFGQVYEGYKDTRGDVQRFAFKVLHAKYDYPEYVKQWHAITKTEAAILAELNPKCTCGTTCESTCECKCEFIVKHYKTFWLGSSKDSPIYAVFKTELLNISLEDYQVTLQARMPLNQAKRLAVQIGEAILYMHKRNIVHHDIKAMNVMMAGFEKDKLTKLAKSPKNLKEYLPKCTPRVIDFGLSKKYPKPTDGESLKESACWDGTNEYKCPAKIDKISYDPLKSDSFSFGMMLSEMLMGIKVFEDKMKWKHKIVKNKPKLNADGEQDVENKPKPKPIAVVVEQVVKDYLARVDNQEKIHEAVLKLVAQDEKTRIHVSEAIEMIRRSA